MKQWFSSHWTWDNKGEGFLRQVTNDVSPSIAQPTEESLQTTEQEGVTHVEPKGHHELKG